MSVRRRPLKVPEWNEATFIDPDWNEATFIEPDWRPATFKEPEYETYGGFGRVVVADSGSHGPAIQTLW